MGRVKETETTSEQANNDGLSKTEKQSEVMTPNGLEASNVPFKNDETVDKNSPIAATEGLQFDRAEPVVEETVRPGCALCKVHFVDEYFEVNGKFVCAACGVLVEQSLQGGSPTRRFLRALGFGALAATLGSCLYFAIVALTGYELGLVGIAVGYMVGKAVKKGSDERGGWPYQVMAMLLTYFAIVSTYVPIIVKEIRNMPAQTASSASVSAQSGTIVPSTASSGVAVSTTPSSATQDLAAVEVSERNLRPPSLFDVAVAWVLIFLIACAAPFLAGLSNIMGWLILAFSVYEAWKYTKRTVLKVSGPYHVTKPQEEVDSATKEAKANAESEVKTELTPANGPSVGP